MEGAPDAPPQLVEIVPRLMMVPIILPQPLRIALLEMVRPLAKICVPPSSSNVAALTPSPTTKGDPLLTTVLLDRSVPLLKSNWPALLVRRRTSVSIVPPLRVIVPLGISATA